MNALKKISDPLLQLIFPNVCQGCGSDFLDPHSMLCFRCISSLPVTDFHMHANNTAEKLFWGRVPLVSATAQYYYSKESLVQHLMHSFKYNNGKALGLQLGRMMGTSLSQTNRFSFIDGLIPLPLFPKKERKRGFNQATILCEGISEVMDKPVFRNAVVRVEHTETQTHKNRIERWTNMEGKFAVIDASLIKGKHLLLVDDVMTTGATLEACASVLLEVSDVQVSLATLCIATK